MEKFDGGMWMPPPDPLSASEQADFEDLSEIVRNCSDMTISQGGTQIMISTDPITLSLHEQLMRLKRRIGT